MPDNLNQPLHPLAQLNLAFKRFKESPNDATLIMLMMSAINFELWRRFRKARAKAEHGSNLPKPKPSDIQQQVSDAVATNVLTNEVRNED